MNYDDLEEWEQQSTDLIAYYYRNIYMYADLYEVDREFLRKDDSQTANTLTMLFQIHGIKKLPYYHYQEALDLVDNWVNDRSKSSAQVASIHVVTSKIVSDVNKLLNSLGDWGVANTKNDMKGVPLIVMSQSYVLQIMNAVMELDREGSSAPELRKIIREKIDYAIKDIPRNVLDDKEMPFGLDFFKGLE